MQINLVFVGSKYYLQSRTFMSSIYKELEDGSLERYDYGFLQIDLERGNTVNIRQITHKEKVLMDDKLLRISGKLNNLGYKTEFPLGDK